MSDDSRKNRIGWLAAVLLFAVVLIMIACEVHKIRMRENSCCSLDEDAVIYVDHYIY